MTVKNGGRRIAPDARQMPTRPRKTSSTTSITAPEPQVAPHIAPTGPTAEEFAMPHADQHAIVEGAKPTPLRQMVNDLDKLVGEVVDAALDTVDAVEGAAATSEARLLSATPAPAAAPAARPADTDRVETFLRWALAQEARDDEPHGGILTTLRLDSLDQVLDYDRCMARLREVAATHPQDTAQWAGDMVLDAYRRLDPVLNGTPQGFIAEAFRSVGDGWDPAVGEDSSPSRNRLAELIATSDEVPTSDA